MKGHSAVKKTISTFSNIALDQAHEQHNAVVKDDGGAVGLTESPTALQWWIFSGPEMARLINKFDEMAGKCSIQPSRHHEQASGQQNKFQSGVAPLVTTLTELGNSFLEM